MAGSFMCFYGFMKTVFKNKEFCIFCRMRIAVIDLGTNTFHLLIGSAGGDVVYKTTVPVLLGQGRINQHIIIPEAFARGIDTLRAFRKVIDDYGVTEIRAVATSAVRSAQNGQDFVDAAKDVGIDIRVITGEEEAGYIFRGVMATGLIKQTSLVMDIGGGSTEFIICHAEGALWKKSYNIGAARLMQAYFHSDPMSGADHHAIITHLDGALGDLKEACSTYKPSLLVGSAGAFESFAALLNDGNELEGVAAASLDYEQYRVIAEKLIAATHAERAGMKGLISLRVDMIVIAAIITNYILDQTGMTALSLSAYDLKWGVLYE
jgi:exopolyphosphatase/guanosine-5'-triphosphate,3'-diphosphate pyrophosphatase